MIEENPTPPDKVKSSAYKGARDRCNNPNHRAYKRYGGRGIQFRFDSYEDYVNELGPRPGPEYSVDRIDNDGHYEPGNIQWATRKQQQNNMHNNVRYNIRRIDSNTIEVTHPDGSITYSKTTKEVSIQLGIKPSTVGNKIRKTQSEDLLKEYYTKLSMGE